MTVATMLWRSCIQCECSGFRPSDSDCQLLCVDSVVAMLPASVTWADPSTLPCTHRMLRVQLYVQPAAPHGAGQHGAA